MSARLYILFQAFLSRGRKPLSASIQQQRLVTSGAVNIEEFIINIRLIQRGKQSLARAWGTALQSVEGDSCLREFRQRGRFDLVVKRSHLLKGFKQVWPCAPPLVDWTLVPIIAVRKHVPIPAGRASQKRREADHPV